MSNPIFGVLADTVLFLIWLVPFLKVCWANMLICFIRISYYPTQIPFSGLQDQSLKPTKMGSCTKQL